MPSDNNFVGPILAEALPGMYDEYIEGRPESSPRGRRNQAKQEIIGKINGNSGGGAYTVTEQAFESGAWANKTGGRVWDGAANLPTVLEINAFESLPVDTFVRVFSKGVVSGGFQWFCEAVYLSQVSADHDTADYLENLIVAGTGIEITVLNDGGAEQLEIKIDPGYLESGDKDFQTLFWCAVDEAWEKNDTLYIDPDINEIRINDSTQTYAIWIHHSDTHGYISTTDPSGGKLHLMDGAHDDLTCFLNAGANETPSFTVYGRNNSDGSRRSIYTTIDSAEDDRALIGSDDTTNLAIDFDIQVFGSTSDDTALGFAVYDDLENELWSTRNDGLSTVNGAWSLPDTDGTVKQFVGTDGATVGDWLGIDDVVAPDDWHTFPLVSGVGTIEHAAGDRVIAAWVATPAAVDKWGHVLIDQSTTSTTSTTTTTTPTSTCSCSFTDSFANTNDWTDENGGGDSPGASAGRLELSSNGHGFFHYNHICCPDSETSINVLATNCGGWYGVIARFSGSSGSSGYWWGGQESPVGQTRLYRGNWSGLTLEDTWSSISTGVHKLRCSGTFIKGYIGGVERTSTVDATYSGSYSGLIYERNVNSWLVDNWDLSAPPACPLVPADPGQQDTVPVWLRVIGIGTAMDPWRVDAPAGVRYRWDDSIIADLDHGTRPLFMFGMVHVPAADVAKCSPVTPPADVLWIWRALVLTRRNAYFVPEGSHPPPEAHCGERPDARGLVTEGWTWPSREVPGGRVYYRPAPFVRCLIGEDNLRPDDMIEAALSKTNFLGWTGGRRQKVRAVFAAMADGGVDKEIMRQAILALAHRRLPLATAQSMVERHGL